LAKSLQLEEASSGTLDRAVTTEAQGRVRLEDLAPGTEVTGLLPSEPATVVAVSWHGSTCVTLTYRTQSGDVGERLVFRDDEESLQIRAAARAFGFDGDPDRFRLVSEARRIRLAYLFDPLLATTPS
jgi:hypothetical protein